MIFGFWTADPTCEGEPLPEGSVEAWTGIWPRFCVYGDEDAASLLRSRWGAAAFALFGSIRIPACRSDLARLVLLHAHGGLYVDLHAAPGRVERLDAVLAALSTHELVIFDESAHQRVDRHTWLRNSAIAARPGSVAIGRMIAQAISGLQHQFDRERASGGGHVAYNVFDLTGPRLLFEECFDRTRTGAELKPDYAGRVAIWPVERNAPDDALYFDRFRAGRHPDRHWSRRQRKEPLFAVVPPTD